MKFNKLIKLIQEMPDFNLQGSKYKTKDGNGIKDTPLEELEKDNIIVYYMEHHPMFPPNYFLIYFMDSKESKDAMLNGEVVPTIIRDSRVGLDGGFNTIWKKKSTDKRILGTVQGFIHEDEIYIKFMTVRGNARKQSINSQMINQLKAEFPGKGITYEDLTDQGKKFKSKYEPEAQP